jgi:hypothetical protein
MHFFATKFLFKGLMLLYIICEIIVGTGDVTFCGTTGAFADLKQTFRVRSEPLVHHQGTVHGVM